MEKSQIINFLQTYGKKASKDEDIAVTELMMDDHKYIEYNMQGYYIYESTTFANPTDEDTFNFLIENFSI
jgi:hypothetical protein